MKILILTTFPYKDKKLEINNCSTFFDTILYFFTKYISQRDDVEVYFENCCPKIKSRTYIQQLKRLIYPNVDHTIVIDHKAFYARVPEFLDKLRMITKGTVCSIGLNNVYHGGEDMLFYIDPRGLRRRDGTCNLGWIIDDELFSPTIKEYEGLNFFINNYDDVYDDVYNKKYKISVKDAKIVVRKIQKFMDKHTTIPIFLKKMTSKGFKLMYDIDNDNRNGDFDYQDINQRYEQYSTADVFFVVNNNVTLNCLFQMAMTNTVIVAPENIFDNSIVKLLEIVTYEESFIPWENIIQKLNGINTRDKLINLGYTWKHAINKIYNFFINHPLHQNSISKIGKAINNSKMITKTNTKSIIKTRKDPVITQQPTSRNQKREIPIIKFKKKDSYDNNRNNEKHQKVDKKKKSRILLQSLLIKN